MTESLEEKVWLPGTLISTDEALNPTTPEDAVILIVLNVPISNTKVFLDICRRAKLRICADGGANRMRDLILTKEQEESYCHVDYIVGDLDSVKPGVLDYYGSRGASIERDGDQNSSDLTKALKLVASLSRQGPESPAQRIAIFGSLEGRADQALSLLHHLYTAQAYEIGIKGDCFLVTSSSIIFLLKKGSNRVHVPLRSGLLTKYAGLVPLRGQVNVTTTGFEWNLSRGELEFGGFISTSNHVEQEEITISASDPILLMLDIA